MWWNFVGRSYGEIVSYRRLWEAHDPRFGQVDGYSGTPARLPAPPCRRLDCCHGMLVNGTLLGRADAARRRRPRPPGVRKPQLEIAFW